MKQPEFDALCDKAIIGQKLLTDEHIREIRVSSRVGIMAPSGRKGSHSLLKEKGSYILRKFFDLKKVWFKL